MSVWDVVYGDEALVGVALRTGSATDYALTITAE